MTKFQIERINEHKYNFFNVDNGILFIRIIKRSPDLEDEYKFEILLDFMPDLSEDEIKKISIDLINNSIFNLFDISINYYRSNEFEFNEYYTRSSIRNKKIDNILKHDNKN